MSLVPIAAASDDGGQVVVGMIRGVSKIAADLFAGCCVLRCVEVVACTLLPWLSWVVDVGLSFLKRR